jgi:hypothetical protein
MRRPRSSRSARVFRIAVALRWDCPNARQEKRPRARVRRQPVPSLVPMHEPTTAKPRDSSRPALGFSAETDSALEGAGFELAVPRKTPGVLAGVRSLSLRLFLVAEIGRGGIWRSCDLGRITRDRESEAGSLPPPSSSHRRSPQLHAKRPCLYGPRLHARR